MKVRTLAVSLLMSVGLMACGSTEPTTIKKITIGVVSDGDTETSAAKYQRFQNYLAEQTQIAVELEVAYNELQAVQQVEEGRWTLVFAPTGVAVVAAQQNYRPIFALEDNNYNEQSLVVVSTDSKLDKLSDLAFQTVGMGNPGSAAGYYVPLHTLYGLTLKSVQFAPSAPQLLAWIADGTVAAGALSKTDYRRYGRQLENADLRVMHESDRTIPSGVVLLGEVGPAQGELIQQVMRTAPVTIISDAQYSPSDPLPDYSDIVEVVEHVQPLEQQVRETPVVLTLKPTKKSTGAPSKAQSVSKPPENLD